MEVKFDQSKVLDSTIDEPKFLYIFREGSNSFKSISPFFIKTVIKKILGNDPKQCVKLRNGCLLVETINLEQANRLIKLIQFGPSMPVKVSESSMNQSKGVFYNMELTRIQDEEILRELQEFHVKEIKRFKKKDSNGNMMDSGLFLITFSRSTLPEFIYLGYEKTYIRPYIPRPLQCLNCFKYYHHGDDCRSDKKCLICGGPYHLKTKEEKCTLPVLCSNCGQNHTPLSKDCPQRIKFREIQTIKTLKRISLRAAKEIYRNQHPLQESYSKIVENKCKCICTCNQNNTLAEIKAPENEEMEEQHSHESSSEFVNNFQEDSTIVNEESSSQITSIINKSNVLVKENSIIFPTNLSKKDKRKVKMAEKEKQKRAKKSISISSDSSESLLGFEH